MELKLDTPDQGKLTAGAKASLDLVNELVITDASMYQIAADEVKAITAKIKLLEDQRMTITRPIDQAKKAVMELFAPAQAALTQASTILRGKMISYAEAEEAKRKAEQARLDAIAAEERKAALARAEEARLAAAAAEKQASLSMEAGDEQGASLALMDVAESSSVAEAESLAAAVISAPVVAEAPAIKGVSIPKVWTFEVEDKMALIKYIAEHPEYADVLEVNDTAMRNLARAMKDKCPIAGVRVFQKSQLRAA